MKKIIMSLLIGVLITIGSLGVLYTLTNNSNSLFTLVVGLLIIQLVIPIIVALSASIKQKEMNPIYSATIATLITSIVNILPLYIFTRLDLIQRIINSKSAVSENGNHIVSVKLNNNFSSSIGQIIMWVMIGTIIGWIVRRIQARNTKFQKA